MRLSSIFLHIILFTLFALSISAQTGSTQINQGKLFVSSTSDEAQIQTPFFNATGNIDYLTGTFTRVCGTETDCMPGKTFSVAGQIYFGENYFRGGNNSITINGTTYQNVFFEGETQLQSSQVKIPKTFGYRKKGDVRFRTPFTYTSLLKVCRVSMSSAPCPSDMLLFDGNLVGHGTLIFTLSSKLIPNFPHHFKVKSFDFRFEP